MIKINYVNNVFNKKMIWSNAGCFSNIKNEWCLDVDSVKIIEIKNALIIKTKSGYVVFDDKLNIIPESVDMRCGLGMELDTRNTTHKYQYTKWGFSYEEISKLKNISHDVFLNEALFLGSIYNEFGHQITEGISRLHFFNESVCEKKIPVITSNLIKNNNFIDVISASGVDINAIFNVSDNLAIKVSRLFIPTQSMNLFGKYSVKSKFIWSNIFLNATSVFDAKNFPKKIFLARSSQRRKCNNNEIIENFFEKNGFSIIYPEKYKILEQISIVGSADYVAGFVGSQMHLTQFMQNGKVVILGSDTFFPSDFYCSAVLNNHNFQALLADGGDVDGESVLHKEFDISIPDIEENIFI